MFLLYRLYQDIFTPERRNPNNCPISATFLMMFPLYRLYQDIFTPDRRNPNNCPISATFFVSHEWTDYGQVDKICFTFCKKLY